MAELGGSHCCGSGYASPAEAMKAPREKLLYTVALYIGTGIPVTASFGVAGGSCVSTGASPGTTVGAGG